MLLADVTRTEKRKTRRATWKLLNAEAININVTEDISSFIAVTTNHCYVSST